MPQNYKAMSPHKKWPAYTIGRTLSEYEGHLIFFHIESETISQKTLPCERVLSLSWKQRKTLTNYRHEIVV